MIKSWAPPSCNRCSKRSPSISRQTAVHGRAFSQIHLNMLPSTLSQLLQDLPRDLGAVLGGTTTFSFRCSHRKKCIGVRSDSQGGHAVGPLPLFRFPGYVAFGHSVLEFRRAETTTFISQLEAHLQAVLVQQLPDNHGIIESDSRRGHDNVS
jgi:hypothetical protein